MELILQPYAIGVPVNILNLYNKTRAVKMLPILNFPKTYITKYIISNFKKKMGERKRIIIIIMKGLATKLVRSSALFRTCPAFSRHPLSLWRPTSWPRSNAQRRLIIGCLALPCFETWPLIRLCLA